MSGTALVEDISRLNPEKDCGVFCFIGNSEGTSYEIKSLRQDVTYVFLLWYGAESRNTFS